MPPILVLWVPLFYAKARINAAILSALGVGVMLPILMLLVLPLRATARVNAAPCKADWCRRNAAHLLCCVLARTLPFILLLNGDKAFFPCCLWDRRYDYL